MVAETQKPVPTVLSDALPAIAGVPPQSSLAPLAAQSLAPATSVPRITDGSYLLIVDDVPVNLQALESILRTKGFRVEKATSGEQALASVQKSP
jgi:PleD family two-component response regulator